MRRTGFIFSSLALSLYIFSFLITMCGKSCLSSNVCFVFVKSQVVIITQTYVWVFCSIPSSYVHVFMLLPYFLSFLITLKYDLKSATKVPPAIFSFLRIAFELFQTHKHGGYFHHLFPFSFFFLGFKFFIV